MSITKPHLLWLLWMAAMAGYALGVGVFPAAVASVVLIVLGLFAMRRLEQAEAS